VPLLGLAAEPALPRLTDQLARDVVVEPVGDLAEPLDRANTGLLVELTQRRRPRILAGIDAALRHLPGMHHVDMLAPAGAAADEDAAGGVEHHGADAGAVRQVFETGHGGTEAATASARQAGE